MKRANGEAMKRVRMIGRVFATNVAQERWGGEGQTLGECQALAENGLLPVGDPYGEEQMISLAPFDGEDPNHYILFSFITLKDGYENFDHVDIGDAVVLKDYEVPAILEDEFNARAGIPSDCGESLMLKKYKLPPGAKMIE
jgi:hypothetical protein